MKPETINCTILIANKQSCRAQGHLNVVEFKLNGRINGSIFVVVGWGSRVIGAFQSRSTTSGPATASSVSVRTTSTTSVDSWRNVVWRWRSSTGRYPQVRGGTGGGGAGGGRGGGHLPRQSTAGETWCGGGGHLRDATPGWGVGRGGRGRGRSMGWEGWGTSTTSVDSWRNGVWRWQSSTGRYPRVRGGTGWEGQGQGVGGVEDIYHVSRQLEKRGVEVAVIYGTLPPGEGWEGEGAGERGVAADLPSLPVYPVDYRFLTPSTGLPDGRTFLPVFHNIAQIFFFRRFIDNFWAIVSFQSGRSIYTDLILL